MAAKKGTERDRRRLKAARAIAGFDSHRALEAGVREINQIRGTRYRLSWSSAGKIESREQLAHQGQLDAVAVACGLNGWEEIDALIDDAARAAGVDPQSLDATTSQPEGGDGSGMVAPGVAPPAPMPPDEDAQHGQTGG